VRLIAHELGHTHRPYHRSSTVEEAKAERYATVATIAFNTMKEMTADREEEREVRL
jgi:hypothetical protein